MKLLIVEKSAVGSFFFLPATSVIEAGIVFTETGR